VVDGGAVGCGLAHFHPSRVRALALVNSVPEGFDRDPAVLASWEREEALWNAGRLDEVIRNDLETWIAGQGRALADVPEEVETLRDAGTDVREVEIAGCAHTGPLERPYAYAAALGGFLDELDW
jgi:pimeloyl-ACP methyl ester carboxylesterase